MTLEINILKLIFCYWALLNRVYCLKLNSCFANIEIITPWWEDQKNGD